MTAPRVVVALVVVVVASSIGVGAATPTATPTATPASSDTQPATMGAAVSSFMAASAAQTGGSVENGMWVAAYANASDNATRRALVQSRVGSLDTSIAELRQERQALQTAYRNGSINRTTYQARLATIVGKLAALGEGIEEADQRGRAVGVNATRLDVLRTQARALGGGAVSAIARNLTGDHGPPGRAGVFGEDHPGPPDGQGPPTDRGGGPPGDRGQGQSDDRGQGQPGGPAEATETPTDDGS